MTDYLISMLSTFNETESSKYPILDRQIGDVLHQVYKPKLGGAQPLQSMLFSFLDAELGSKKT
jgi:hypothetical protein